ncbi:MAG: hypothetical protein Q8L98_00180 [Chlamydiales bacterium]|nr:hypothetical protein [Chlamydiales bacterium]
MLTGLNAKNFFHYYIFNPRAPELTENERVIAVTSSIALAIFTCGIVHLACIFLYNHSFAIKKTASENKIDRAADPIFSLNSKTPVVQSTSNASLVKNCEQARNNSENPVIPELPENLATAIQIPLPESSESTLSEKSKQQQSSQNSLELNTAKKEEQEKLTNQVPVSQVALEPIEIKLEGDKAANALENLIDCLEIYINFSRKEEAFCLQKEDWVDGYKNELEELSKILRSQGILNKGQVSALIEIFFKMWLDEGQIILSSFKEGEYYLLQGAEKTTLIENRSSLEKFLEENREEDLEKLYTNTIEILCEIYKIKTCRFENTVWFTKFKATAELLYMGNFCYSLYEFIERIDRYDLITINALLSKISVISEQIKQHNYIFIDAGVMFDKERICDLDILIDRLGEFKNDIDSHTVINELLSVASEAFVGYMVHLNVNKNYNYKKNRALNYC